MKNEEIQNTLSLLADKIGRLVVDLSMKESQLISCQREIERLTKLLEEDKNSGSV